MDTAAESRAPGAFSALLAGLQAGMLGGLAMLTFLGIGSVWYGRTFWTPENLLASSHYGDAAIRNSFSDCTAFGIGVYLFSYPLIGAAFAAAVQERLTPLRLTLAGAVFGVAWYFLTFHWFWGLWTPLVGLLHPVRYTVLGHVLYGVVLARYPLYMEGRASMQAAAGGSAQPYPHAEPGLPEAAEPGLPEA
jgi:hypothetical protein